MEDYNYAADGDIAETWSAYHGKQQGDPAKLGEGSGQNCWHGEPAETVPRLESDALTVVAPGLEAWLQEMRAYEDLSSKPTKFSFPTVKHNLVFMCHIT